MQRRYAAIAAAGALALSASPAAAHTRAKIKCGQTLTQSVRLTDDLVNCPGDGLVIGADGITVDLGGHTLDGVASAAACDVRPANAGIRNTGYDRVTLVNGTIKQFDLGVEAGSDANGMSDEPGARPRAARGSQRRNRTRQRRGRRRHGRQPDRRQRRARRPLRHGNRAQHRRARTASRTTACATSAPAS